MGTGKYRAIAQLPQLLWKGKKKYTNQSEVQAQSKTFSKYLFSWSPGLTLVRKEQENKVKKLKRVKILLEL